MNQSWTLSAELTFYLVAPLLLRLWKLAAALLVASLSLRASFVAVLGPAIHSQWTYTFLPSTVAFFLLSHFAMRIGAKWQELENSYVGTAQIVAAFITMRFGPGLGTGTSFDSTRF
jgi:peptidoglycan/LPS O-acetylase OafA/YrhL